MVQERKRWTCERVLRKEGVQRRDTWLVEKKARDKERAVNEKGQHHSEVLGEKSLMHEIKGRI